MTAGKKILLIDGDAGLLVGDRWLLEGEGYALFEARNGAEGLTKLRRHRPDLIVLDITAHTTPDGYSLAEALVFAPEHREFRDVPLIVVSDALPRDSDESGHEHESDLVPPERWFTLPLNTRRFLRVVRETMGVRVNTSAPMSLASGPIGADVELPALGVAREPLS
jgi:CheY-like chemotaxis protein